MLASVYMNSIELAGVWLNAHGNIPFINDKCESIFDLSCRGLSHLILSAEKGSSLSDINEDTAFFFLLAEGGLSNRIRALASASVLSEVLCKDIRLCWIPNYSCPSSLSDLFDPARICSCIGINILNPIDYRRAISVCKSFYEDRSLFSAWNYWELFVKDHGVVDWVQYYDLYKDRLRKIFSNLSPGIIDRANQLYEKFAGRRFIGVHMRGTDFKEHYEKVYHGRRLPTANDFVIELNKYSNEYALFVCSDDDEMLREFSKSCTRSFICNDHVYHKDRYRKTSVADSLVDLVVLSRCDLVLGTFGSSFSEMACDLGCMQFTPLELAI